MVGCKIRQQGYEHKLSFKNQRVIGKLYLVVWFVQAGTLPASMKCIIHPDYDLSYLPILNGGTIHNYLAKTHYQTVTPSPV